MAEDLKGRLGPVGVWVNWGADVPVAAIREAAAAIEELGYGALWFAETQRSREAFVQAALLLGATQRIVVATGITSVYSRDAIAMHAGSAALAEAFGDRFVLGLGVSHAPAVQGRGHEYGKPIATMRGYLDALEACAAEAPGPPPAPRVLAALRPKMLGLAAARAAGAHPYFVTPEHSARARAALGDGPLLAPEQTVVLDADPQTARTTARAFMHRYLSLPNYRNNLLDLGFAEDALDPEAPADATVDALVAWGDEGAIAARVRAHHDAGADHVCVQALAPDPAAAVAALRRLAPALLGG
jgi:probable F420-dependent oxidoreductase